MNALLRAETKSNIVKRSDILKIYTDGAANPNPGKGAAAYVYVVNEMIIDQDYQYLGHTTNNQAEFKAVAYALDKAMGFTRWSIQIFSDSQFVINTMNRKFRIHQNSTKPLFYEVLNKSAAFSSVEYYLVNRTNTYIKIADNLCNDCLNKNLGTSFPLARE